MKLYRIIKAEHIATAWSGYGAQQFGGRWNHPGKSVVYTASSISLAMLEILVHLQKSQFFANYLLLSIAIPDKKVDKLNQKQLPKDWNIFPASDSTMNIGDNWVMQQKSIGLQVPSVIIPLEYNVIINPTHPEFMPCLTTVKTEQVYFDTRLLPLQL